MVMVQPEQALTLAAIITEGTFDAAAQRLHLTPSAVSQRVRALEMAIGRPVLRRVRPVELTPAGEAVVRFARQLELLSVDLSNQLEPSADGSAPRITLVVNSDSLHTWALPGLVQVAEDQVEGGAHVLDLRWFADGVNRTSLSTAPVVTYDDKDDLQDRYLRRRRRTAL
jgi:LysR family transcriptional regulator (chromosome initiation inhibitor)